MELTQFPVGENHSPLVVAALNGHVQIVEMLLENGVESSLWDWKFNSALGAAALNRHEDVIKILIEQGATVN
jgi:ankyrin repeat protein